MLRRLLIASSLLFVGVCLGGEPAPELVRYEWSVETSAALTSVPANAPSTIDVRACALCKPVSLEMTNDTRYFLVSGNARVEVSLAELKNLSRDEMTMGVFYLPETMRVTRIVIFGLKAADLIPYGAQR